MRWFVLTLLGHVEVQVFGALVPGPKKHDLGLDRLTVHRCLDVLKLLA